MVQMKQNQVQQKEIRLGTHGEHYGSWMSNPVFYVIGALLALSVVLAVLSFAVFHITALGVAVSYTHLDVYKRQDHDNAEARP